MNIIGRRKLWYSISLAIIVPGLIALAVWGLKPGIDFAGDCIDWLSLHLAATCYWVDSGCRSCRQTQLRRATVGSSFFQLRTVSPADVATCSLFILNLYWIYPD